MSWHAGLGREIAAEFAALSRFDRWSRGVRFYRRSVRAVVIDEQPVVITYLCGREIPRTTCRNCSAPIAQNRGGRRRVYCSAFCRTRGSNPLVRWVRRLPPGRLAS